MPTIAKSKPVNAGPVYVNLQTTAVHVYDEKGRRIIVQPWERRGTMPNGCFHVQGGHYHQFVSGKGPLYPFPGPGTLEVELLPELARTHARTQALGKSEGDGDGTAARASQGRFRATGDVLAGGETKGQTIEELARELRPALAAVGITNAQQFDHAAAQQLLQVEGVTETNLPRVRELTATIFPPVRVCPTTNLPLNDAGERVYRLDALEGMAKSKLRVIVDREEIDIPKSWDTTKTREALIATLRAHKMLDARS